MAQCSQGREVPQIVNNANRHGWKRKEVLDWLKQVHCSGIKVLAGFDFAFAYPYCDNGAYFPGHDDTPKNTEALWELIDSICKDALDFYGGPFYLSQDTAFSDYLLYQTYRGRYYSNRMRITETRCKEMGGNPANVFKCVGPESVGIGSLAGMRMVHHTKSNYAKDFLIWPFEQLDNHRSVFVEIFPRLYYLLAEEDPQDWRNMDTVNKVLKFYGTEELSTDMTIESGDQIDAIVSAAAIRYFASKPKTWQPDNLCECARNYEGWIFGS